MIVLGLAINQFAEKSVPVKAARGDGLRAIMARFRHHVGEARALFRFLNGRGFLERATGRNRTDHMLSVFHAIDDMPGVVGGFRKYAHRVDGGVLNKLFQRLISLFTAVFLLQPFAPFGNEVADRLDDAIRVFVPVEREAKASPHNPDADRRVGGLLPGRSHGQGLCGCPRQHDAGSAGRGGFHKAAPREGRSFQGVTMSHRAFS